MNGNKAKAARATKTLHRLRKKYNNAEMNGMRKGADAAWEGFRTWAFFDKVKFLFL